MSAGAAILIVGILALMVFSKGFRKVVFVLVALAGIGGTAFVWWADPSMRPAFVNTMVGQPWLNDPVVASRPPTCTKEQMAKINAVDPQWSGFRLMAGQTLTVPGSKAACMTP